MDKIIEASENEDHSSFDVSETDPEQKRALWDYYGRPNESSTTDKDEEDGDIVGLLLDSFRQPTAKEVDVQNPNTEAVGTVVQPDGWSDDEDDLTTGHASAQDQELPRPTISFHNSSSDDLSNYAGAHDSELPVDRVGGRYSSDLSSTSADLELIHARTDWSSSGDEGEVAENGYGVVHVELLQARGLLCPIHTQVQAVLRLLPWKGCVRLEKVTADFSSDSVSVKWPEGAVASMVHSYSEGSPFPSLQVDLVMVTPLFLEFKMASLSVNCMKLFSSPGNVSRQWFKTDKEPVLELRAWFEPSMENDESTIPQSDSSNNFLLENVSIVSDRKPAQLDHDMDSATQMTRIIPAHLLHHYSYRSTPANCCVCHKSIFWSSGSLQCESCQVDCCQDCRLTIDVALPCGSDAAQKAVESAVQSRWTAERILNIMAPLSSGNPRSEVTDSVSEHQGGIGMLQMEIGKAYVLQEALPPETDTPEFFNHVQQLRSGDYYVRVASCRTRTIQHSQGRPNFNNHPMKMVVPHYGAEYRLDLIDGSTDLIVGSAMMSAQILLQQQRDVLIETLPFLSFVRPLTFERLRPMTLELRYYGSKEVDSVDFFSQPKQAAGESDLARPGDIVGCIDINACLEENWNGMFSSDPYECPSRPGHDLDMGVFQLQIQRISFFVEDMKTLAATYIHVVSWKDPFLTTLSLLVFLQLVFWLNPAYIGSVPIFLLIVLMLYLGVRRVSGKLKHSFTRREIERKKKAESGTIGYDIHRPVGRIRVRIKEGRNIRSPELGLPGNVGCRVFWDPCSVGAPKKVIDHATLSQHDLGTTGFVYSTSPLWGRVFPSENARRLDILLPTSGAFFDEKGHAEQEQRTQLEFPFLQPIDMLNDLPFLEPFEKIPGNLVVEINFSDLLNVLPNSVYSIGEVTIPIKKLVKEGKLGGWFDVTVNQLPSRFQLASDTDTAKTETPQVQFEASWVPPDSTSDFPVEMQREASVAIQEELVRSALLSKQQKEKLSILGSSIGALNTVRGISTNLHMVQNTLCTVLDIVEGSLHLFDFTDPFKSLLVLGVLIVLWVILSIVSTRAIVLIIGLVSKRGHLLAFLTHDVCLVQAQYAVTFNARFGRQLRREGGRNKTSSGDPPQEEKKAKALPIDKWILNAIRGIPTSEDLRQTYFWDSRREGTKATEQRIAEKRRARMQRLWRVQWYCPVRILGSENPRNSLEWRTAFALLHGRRLLWWRSVVDFDNGEPCLGQLFLAGHAGLSNPSPLELREIDPRDVPRVACVFGNGARVTILTQTEDSKRELEEVIQSALVNKVD